MHFPLWTSATCLALLPLSAAFYPIHPSYGPASTSSESDQASERRAVGDSPRHSLLLPLRRVPTRRTNAFSIITASKPQQSASVGIDQDGSDYSYMVSVLFGSSNEPYHLLVDSAASNTWVMGSDCKSDICNAHNTFGKEDSKTLTTSANTFGITYGTGNVSGVTASDTVHFAGFDVPLSFGLATDVSQEFKSYPMDGILGLGRLAPSEGIGASSIMDVLSTQKLIKAKLFGVHLSRSSSGAKDGELNLGEPNKARYDGDLAYSSIINNDKGFWEIPMDDAVVGGKNLGLKDRTVILDTGTSFILMAQPDAVALHKAIPGSSQNGELFQVPCTSTTSIQLTINGVSYSISPSDYIGSPTNGACGSNIIGRQTFGEKQWLVGDVFLKNVYTVFDFDQKRIGLGVKGGSTPTSSSSPSSTSSSGSTRDASVTQTGTSTIITSKSGDGSLFPSTGTLAQLPTGDPSGPILPNGSVHATAASQQSSSTSASTSHTGAASAYSLSLFTTLISSFTVFTVFLL